MTEPIEWIAADWGTSHLRVFAIGADGSVRDRAGSDKGMGALAPAGFEPALLELVEPWLAPGRVTPVYACGMVGARQGWIEAAYGPVPGKPLGADPVLAPTADDRIVVRIVPGLAQTDPADVMRGEETQIAGLIASDAGFEGAACLPGTHSKWARVENGTVARFATFLTGELFALLSRQSVLRHSVQADGWSEEGFARGLDRAIEAPARLTGHLFSLRARSLLSEPDPAFARAELSGLLIGVELMAARPYWQTGTVALIGEDALCRAYAIGLARFGVRATTRDATALTLSGLAAARNRYGDIRP